MNMNQLITVLAKSQRYFIDFIRIAIFIVTFWIGGLKVANYEAEGIAPFVANSPFLSFFYNDPQHYKPHMNKEGQVVEANMEWHKANGSYTFAYILGAAIVLFGLLTLLGIWLPKAGMFGGLLIGLMAFVTLSFLITTPEAYVPDLGGPNHGFPYLSGAGRLVIKDVIMMAGALVCASDSARALLKLKP
jgi:uncharacterized membrane protein YkgB